MRGRGWRGRGRRCLPVREVETSGCVVDSCGERLAPVREEVIVEVVPDGGDDRRAHLRGPAPCAEALGGMCRGGVVVGGDEQALACRRRGEGAEIGFGEGGGHGQRGGQAVCRASAVSMP